MTTLHTVLAASFVAVTGILLGLTLIQRSRIRGVRMSWVSTGLGSLPVWPSVFMGLVLVVMLYSSNTVASVDTNLYIGYFLGGILWFSAVYLGGSVVVTDYGIIPQATRSNDALGWGQVTDWFEQEESTSVRFTFLYQDGLGHRQRMDVVVPGPCLDRFRHLIRTKLDPSTTPPVAPVHHRQALNN
jgi:hypothetical protein